MVYLVRGLTEMGQITMVKADSEDKVIELFRLKNPDSIVGRLTDNEIAVLNSSKFVVIQA